MKPVIITVFDSEKGTTTDYTFAKSPIRIGRNPLNDLALPFPFVSGWHAVVRFDENQPRFYDLGSTNGTLYEGRRIQPGEPLDVGQLLSVTIGRLELRLRRGDQVVKSGTQPGGVMRPPAVTPTQISQAQPPVLGQPPIGGSMPPSHPGLVPTGSFPTAARPAPAAAQGVLDSSQAVPGPEKGDGTAHVQMGAVHSMIGSARPRYEMFKQAGAHLVAELAHSIGSMPPPLQQLAVVMVAREFPELPTLPEFSDLCARLGAKVPAAGGGGGGGGAMFAAVKRLSEQVRVGEEPPKSPEEADRFLACVSDVLMAGAGALIELQKGQEQFGNEMGVRVIKEFTPLHAAGTPENLLRYLLDWNQGGPHRTQELRGVYADLMIHQVALIRGIVEGARSLIARLDPREIERGLASAWPSKNAAAWRAYEQLWNEIAHNDRKITELVFGPDFARAYAEVGGEG